MLPLVKTTKEREQGKQKPRCKNHANKHPLIASKRGYNTVIFTLKRGYNPVITT